MTVEAVRNRGYRLSSSSGYSLPGGDRQSDRYCLGRTKRVLFYRNRFHQYSGENDWEIRGRLHGTLAVSRIGRLPEKAEEEEPGSLRRIRIFICHFLLRPEIRTGQSTHADLGHGICGCNGASGMYGSGCTDQMAQ